ncbi:hypothetical protein [Alterisphingorhabdus coralli]|uniref:Uncharacterized protein n=1 Tax=Alterisphingorhabdus coralli TaxID=3071408 RepID=A0AA97F8S7_9SPHN|nr:hypothetical protein [Parasphingorhabdus sp. SCSIO 66989]WOE76479.1 hypothetical protein RB602_07130 [Parasphingorhabdus sp. SCSIO 66989]
MAQDQNFQMDDSQPANKATVLGWMVAPALLFATLYLSSVGPMVVVDDAADTGTNVSQVFSVRYFS